MRLCFVLLLISLNCNGQHLPELWDNKNIKRPLSFVSIREADITWAKRVWRTIDLREKLNHPLRYPLIAHKKKSSLFDVLKKALLSGLITPLEIGKDEFLTNIPADSIVKLLIRKKNVFYKDEFEKTYPRQINDTVRSDDIYQYFIIEDYFFDASRSVLDSRIRAICPVRYNNISEKMEPLFWVNFDECRNIFANHTALNSKNDSRKISYDDLFNKRMYNSVITKESNIFDREITEYTKGIESLYEAERIKQSIYNFESDFWQY